MLEQYYKYLCSRLVSWARESSISAGDRFSLVLEEENQVSSFIKTLEKSEDVSNFTISEESGTNFEGMSFVVNDSQLKLVIVSTDNVTSAYLVNLRNRIVKQDGSWNNTAILFISNKPLDSISKGTKDLSRNDGPFNLNELRENLSQEIDQSSNLTDDDKKILPLMVQSVFESDETYTLMDFADVYSIIENGKIEATDFNNMGYFYDSDLASYSDKKNSIRDRLIENHEDFSEIEQDHSFSDVKAKVAKLVAGDELIGDLAGDEWQKVKYGKVIKGKEKFEIDNKVKIEYLSDDLKSLNPDLKIWDKAENEKTKAGSRKRQLLIFNPTKIDRFEVKLPFDNRVYGSRIDNKSKRVQLSSSKKYLVASFTEMNTNEAVSVSFSYHPSKTSSVKFDFNVVVFPFSEETIADLRPVYKLKVQPNKSFILKIPSEIDDFTIGTGDIEEVINAQSVADINGLTIDNNRQIIFKMDDFNLTDDSHDDFDIVIGTTIVNFSLVDEDENVKITPKNALFIESYRRRHEVDGFFNNGKVVFGEQTFSIWGSQRPYVVAEKSAINGDLLLPNNSLHLSAELTQKYQNLFAILRKRQTIMSLVYWDDQIKAIVQEIVDQVKEEINSAEEKVNLNRQIASLARIGELEINGSLSFAPFNPILLSYQLEVERRIGKENLSGTIQKKLTPIHLVPFLKRDGKHNFRSYFSSDAPRWLLYSESNVSKFSEVSQSIVTERLKDFKKHFNYLFDINPDSSFNVRIVGISDEKPIIKSITDFLCDEVANALKAKRNIKLINPVNVYISNTNRNSFSPDFNGFYNINNDTEYEDFFSSSLPIKGLNEDQKMDVIGLLKSKLNVFYNADEDVSYYITFYQFGNGLNLSQYSSEKLNMNYSIEGLIGGDEYTQAQGNIKDGFGTRGLDQNYQSEILDFSKSWNELLVATSNEDGVMIHGQTLVNSVKELDSDEFKSQFDSSKWVTLLTPEVKLDYFNKMSSEIYVIHYTDYSNSTNYESITLTKQVDQYENILSENLPADAEYDDKIEYLDTIIKSFNVILNYSYLSKKSSVFMFFKN